MKYKAFISYSHKDEKWGRRLHRNLEAYRVPRSIVGAAGRDGPILERLGTIFRDREELPTSADLGTALVDALDSSEYLIVICSPSSGRSRWVNEEVMHFKRTGKENRILPFVISGEPNSTDRGLPEQECFSPALRFAIGENGEITERRTEPIAADARSTGDGYKDAFLKLVAGLLGVDFDLLKQREKRRHRSRIRKIQAAVAGVVVIFSGLMLVAYIQSNRAKTAMIISKDLQGVAKQLKERWTGVDVQTTPLIDAVLLGDLDGLDELNPTLEELNALWGPDNLTPLMIACSVGNVRSVEWLLSNGADHGIYNDHGVAAIHIAADKGNAQVLEPLKHAGADLNAPSRVRESLGWRPIDIAAEVGHSDVVEKLIQLGVPIEVNTTSLNHYSSPLFVAAWFGSEEVVKTLLKHGAKIDIYDPLGRTPYRVAVGAGRTDIADLLAYTEGVSKDDAKSEQLDASIHLIIIGQEGIGFAEQLLIEGADPNFINQYGHTVFSSAVMMVSAIKDDTSLSQSRIDGMNLIQILLDNGADPNAESPVVSLSVQEFLEMNGDHELLKLIFDQ